jgi:hypothetical protein
MATVRAIRSGVCNISMEPAALLLGERRMANLLAELASVAVVVLAAAALLAVVATRISWMSEVVEGEANLETAATFEEGAAVAGAATTGGSTSGGSGGEASALEAREARLAQLSNSGSSGGGGDDVGGGAEQQQQLKQQQRPQQQP